jgi:uncharacterized protein YwgA
MHTQNTILLVLDAFGGKISGKTLLQKRLYFVGELLAQDYGYHAHYYGPYSDEVSGGVAALKNLGRIREDCLPYGIVGGRGFDVMRFDYRLTSAGQEAVRCLKQSSAKETRAIAETAKRVVEAGNLDYVGLSIAAKAHYILRKAKKSMTAEEITSAAKGFSWQVKPEEIKKAIGFLHKLELVTLK